MNRKIAKLDKRPLYIQIRDDLEEYIRRNGLGPGDRLTSDNVLAEQYEVSVGTMRRALQEMVDAGLLWRHRGKGTFLTEAVTCLKD